MPEKQIEFFRNARESDVTHAEVGQLKPQNKDSLECEIPWDVVEDKPQGNALCQVEESKDDPVGEPLDVILWRGAFQGFKGEVRGEGPCDKVRDRSGKWVDEMEEGEEDDNSNGQECLGDLRVLLKRVQNWVLCKLLDKIG